MGVMKNRDRRRYRETWFALGMGSRLAAFSSIAICWDFRVAAVGSVDHGVAAVGGGSTASRTSRKLVMTTIVEGAESAS